MTCLGERASAVKNRNGVGATEICGIRSAYVDLLQVGLDGADPIAWARVLL